MNKKGCKILLCCILVVAFSIDLSLFSFAAEGQAGINFSSVSPPLTGKKDPPSKPAPDPPRRRNPDPPRRWSPDLPSRSNSESRAKDWQKDNYYLDQEPSRKGEKIEAKKDGGFAATKPTKSIGMNPNTGDDRRMEIFIVLVVVSAIAIFFLWPGRKKKGKRGIENRTKTAR